MEEEEEKVIQQQGVATPVSPVNSPIEATNTTAVQPTEEVDTPKTNINENGIDQDRLKGLYDVVTPHANIGDYETFSSKMNESRFRRRKFFSNISSVVNVGSFEEMEGKLMPNPDSDYIKGDAAFDQFGHKMFDEDLRPMDTIEDNVRTSQEMLRAYDLGYQNELKKNINKSGEEEGLKQTEEWYESRLHEKNFIQDSYNKQGIEYKWGQILNKAKKDALSGQSNDPNNPINGLISNINKATAEVLYEDNPEKMKQFNLMESLREDKKILEKYKKTSGSFGGSEEFIKNQQAAIDKKRLEIANLKYESINNSRSELTELKEALTSDNISGATLLRYVTKDGNVPEQFKNIDASQTYNMNEESLAGVRDIVVDQFTTKAESYNQFFKEGEESANQAANDIMAYTLDDDVLPKNMNGREKLQLLFSIYGMQLNTYFTNRGDITFGEKLKSIFGDGKAADDYYLGLAQKLKQFADIPLLNENPVDLDKGFLRNRIDDAGAILGGAVDHISGGGNNEFSLSKAMTGKSSNPFADSRWLISEGQRIGAINKESLTEEAIDNLGAVHDFDSNLNKKNGMDREFWTDILGTSLGIAGEAMIGGGGAKALLKSGKFGKTILKLSKADPKKIKWAFINGGRYKNSSGFMAQVYSKGSQAISQGVTYQTAGMLFPRDIDELNFASGFVGSVAGETATSLLSKGRSGMVNLVRLFGDKGSKQVARKTSAFGRFLKERNKQGIGEAAEELGQEMTGLFIDERSDVFAGFEEKYGKGDNMMNLLISSYVLGIMMPGGSPLSEHFERYVVQNRPKLTNSQQFQFNRFQSDWEKSESDAVEETVAIALLPAPREAQYTPYTPEEVAAVFDGVESQEGLKVAISTVTKEAATRGKAKGIRDQIRKIKDPDTRAKLMSDYVKAVREQKGQKPIDGYLSESRMEIVPAIDPSEARGMTALESVGEEGVVPQPFEYEPSEMLPITPVSAETELSEIVAHNKAVAEGGKQGVTFLVDEEVDSNTEQEAAEQMMGDTQFQVPVLHVGTGVAWVLDKFLPKHPIFDRVRKHGDKWLTSEGGTPPLTKDAKQESVGRITYRMKNFSKMVKEAEEKMRKIYGEKYESELKNLNKRLRGGAEIENAEAEGIIAGLRMAIDDLQDELIKAGVTSDGMTLTLQQNKGSYVHTSYQKHTDPNWAMKVRTENPELIEDAKKSIRKKYEKNGETISDEEIDGIITDLITKDLNTVILKKAGSLSSISSNVLKQTKRAKEFRTALAKLKLKLRAEKRKKNPREAVVSELELEIENISIEAYDIEPEIRALLGEYQDPFYNAMNTLKKQVELVETYKFLTKVKELGIEGGWLKTSKERDSEFAFAIPPTSGLSTHPLNDLYTTQEIAEAFSDFVGERQVNDFVKVLSAINYTAGLSKTVLNPGSAVINLTGAYLSLSANGDLTNSFKFFNDAFSQLVSDKSNTKLMEVMSKVGAEKGILGQGITSAQLREFMANMSGENSTTADAFESYAGSVSEDYYKTARKATGLFKKGGKLGGIGNVFSKFKEGSQKFYELGDDFPKFIGWISQTQKYMMTDPTFKRDVETKGVEYAMEQAVNDGRFEAMAKQTAEVVKNTVPTFSKIPKLVQKFKLFPLAANFVGFASEAIRCSINIPLQAGKELSSENAEVRKIGAKRMFGYIAFMGMFPAMQALSREALGLDEDEEDLIRELGPEWLKNSTLLFTGRDEKGNAKFIDTGRLNPFGLPYEFVSELFAGNFKDAAGAPLAPFLSESFALQAIIDATRGKTKMGQDVYSEVDTDLEKFSKASYHVINSVVGNGYSKFFTDLKKAYDGKETYAGTEYGVEDAILSFFGYKENVVNIEKSIKSKARKINSRLGESRKKKYKGKYKSTEEEGVKDANEALEREYKSAKEMYDLMIKAGLDEDEVYELLREGGLSKNVIKRIKSGEAEILMTDADELKLKQLNED